MWSDCRFLRSAFCAAVAALAIASLAVGADVTTCTLKARFLDFAWCPESGVLAAIDPEGKRVAFMRESDLGTSAAESASQTLPAMPIAMTYKATGDGKGVFAVVCSERDEILLFDALTLKPAGTVTLANTKPTGVASSSSSSDPYLYYTFGRGHDAAVAAIEIDRLLDLGKVTISGAHSSVMDFTLSVDGKFAYPRGPWSPSGFGVLRLNPPGDGQGAFTAEQVFYKHESVTGYLPDPNGDMVICGKAVHDPLLKEKLGELPVDASAFMPGQPVVFGLEGGQVVAMSTNTFKVVGRKALPDWPASDPREGRAERRSLKVPNPNGDFKRFDYRERVYGDAARKVVIVASEARIWKLPVDTVVTEPEPLLSVSARLPEAFMVGATTEVPVQTRDPRVKVSLASAPAGVSLRGDALVWTPTSAQVGDARIELRLVAGSVERTHSLVARVVQPSVRLPFPAGSVQLSPSGDRAVVWATDESPMPIGGQPNFGSRLAVVDTAGRRLVATREFAKVVTHVLIGPEGVFCALRDSDALQVLNPADLSDGETIFLNGRVQDMQFTGDGLLSVLEGRGSVVFVQRPSLKTLVRGSIGVALGISQSRPAGALPLWTGDGWAFEGILYDGELKSPRLLLEPWFLPCVPGMSASDESTSGLRGKRTGAWGRCSPGASIVTESGRQVAAFSADATIILRSEPAAVSLRSETAYDGTSNARTVSLTVRDLVSGNPDPAIVLLKERDQERSSGYSGQRDPLDSVGTRVAAVVDDRLFVVDLDEASVKAKPRPLTLRCVDERIVAVAGEAAKIRYEAEGGQPPYEFELLRPFEGVTLDRTSGTLTVEGDSAIKAALEQADGILMQAAQRGDSQSDRSSLGFDAAKAALAGLIGRPAVGIPVAIPIEVIARDSLNERAALVNAVVVEVPDSRIQEAVSSRARRQPRPQAGAPVDESQGLRARVDQLEARLATLEGKIEMLMEILRSLKTEPDRK